MLAGHADAELGAVFGQHVLVMGANKGDELVALVGAHYEDMLSEYGTELGVRMARKHIGWYLDASGELSNAQRRPIMTENDPRAVLRLMPELFEQTWSQAA